MYTVAMSSVPNQEFDVYLDGIRYHFRLHLFRDMLYADVLVNEREVARSIRCVDRAWIIPFEYKNAGYGNFRFEDDTDGTYPDWERFGTKCYLRFYTTEEKEEM